MRLSVARIWDLTKVDFHVMIMTCHLHRLQIQPLLSSHFYFLVVLSESFLDGALNYRQISKVDMHRNWMLFVWFMNFNALEVRNTEWGVPSLTCFGCTCHVLFSRIGLDTPSNSSLSLPNMIAWRAQWVLGNHNMNHIEIQGPRIQFSCQILKHMTTWPGKLDL